MKNKMLKKSVSIPLLLLVAAGCSSVSEPQQVKETTAAPTKQVKIEVKATIAKSGLATPLMNNGSVVGYNYKRSFMIPAVKGNYFGFSYTAEQQMQLSANSTTAKGEVKSRVPVTIKVTHPEIKQTNGQVSTESSWRDTLYFGRPNHTIWQFEGDHELVSGKWTMSVHYQGNTIAEKNFLVKKLPPMPKKITQVCSADETLYPAPLAKAHQACCTNDDAQACYNFAWRGVERLKDITGAVLYYGRGCDLGDVSSCRAAGQKAKTAQEKKAWFTKGCKLKDFDSCLEVGKSSY